MSAFCYVAALIWWCIEGCRGVEVFDTRDARGLEMSFRLIIGNSDIRPHQYRNCPTAIGLSSEQ